jgi:NAD+ diphosphatase
MFLTVDQYVDRVAVDDIGDGSGSIRCGRDRGSVGYVVATPGSHEAHDEQPTTHGVVLSGDYVAAVPSFSPLNFPPAEHVDGPARWFGVRGAKVLVNDRREFDGDAHFLGVLDGVGCWAEDIADHAADEAMFSDLRGLYGRLDEVEWVVAGRAVQIVEWSRTHRFCGRCGTATVPNGNDRSMKCPQCGLLAFPRLAPAIITLITRNGGEEALLARGVNFPLPMYSALAGFVEPGESLEQAVAREVFEEVGVRIGSIAYHSSQPWPFPHSLMLGFTAEWVEGEINIDPSEIVDANWYTREDLPMIPPGISIARKLIDAWLESAA